MQCIHRVHIEFRDGRLEKGGGLKNAFKTIQPANLWNKTMQRRRRGVPFQVPRRRAITKGWQTIYVKMLK